MRFFLKLIKSSLFKFLIILIIIFFYLDLRAIIKDKKNDKYFFEISQEIKESSSNIKSSLSILKDLITYDSVKNLMQLKQFKNVKFRFLKASSSESFDDKLSQLSCGDYFDISIKEGDKTLNLTNVNLESLENKFNLNLDYLAIKANHDVEEVFVVNELTDKKNIKLKISNVKKDTNLKDIHLVKYFFNESRHLGLEIIHCSSILNTKVTLERLNGDIIKVKDGFKFTLNFKNVPIWLKKVLVGLNLNDEIYILLNKELIDDNFIDFFEFDKEILQESNFLMKDDYFFLKMKIINVY